MFLCKALFHRSYSFRKFGSEFRFPKEQEKEKKDIRKTVYISKENDVYSNLALEDWFYKNHDFTNNPCLLLWRNNPCVVIGRYQNPWLEANISKLDEEGVVLARRASGGGAVYQDLGNLNMTFFTNRSVYDRKKNLEDLANALFRRFGLVVSMSSKLDLNLGCHFKVSGTAAKVGKSNAYHHCTVLVNVDKRKLRNLLQKRDTGIFTNATKSVPVPVMNLSEIHQTITVESLMEAVSQHYLNCDSNFKNNWHYAVKYIQPNEDSFPGWSESRKIFASWDWCYGKTPQFSVKKYFQIPKTFKTNTCFDDNEYDRELKVTLEVKDSHIEDAQVHIPLQVNTIQDLVKNKEIDFLKGCKFKDEYLSDLNF